MVSLKIVSNVSRFNPALNLNRVLAFFCRDLNSLNSVSERKKENENKSENVRVDQRLKFKM